MSIQDLMTNDGQYDHVALGQPDPTTGAYYTPADLPAAPAGKEWISRGMGNYSLVPSADAPAIQAADQRNMAMYGPDSAATRERMKYEQIAKERGYTSPEVMKSLEKAFYDYENDPNTQLLRNEAAQAGMVNPFTGETKQVNENLGQNPYAQALVDAGYAFGGPKVGLGGDTGYTGGNISAGQAAMGRAADLARTNYQSSLSSMNQAGYGAGEVARNAARAAAQAETPSYSMPDAQAEAATAASPAMQGTEDTAAATYGLDAPLTAPEPSVASKLVDALKSTPIVGNVMKAGEGVAKLGSAVGSALGSLGSLATPSTSTPSSTGGRTDTTGMATPMSTPSYNVQPTNVTKTTTEKPLAPMASPTAPKGPYKATLAPALTAKLRNQGLDRNIEYGYNKLATPYSARSNYARPSRGMAGMG